MIRVAARSRLHFGLFCLPGPDGEPRAWGDLPARHFGGVGLMVDEPGLVLHIERASHWSAEGPSSERALHFAETFDASRPCRIVVERCPLEHVGLGVGTQLGLAVAWGCSQLSEPEALASHGHLPSLTLPALAKLAQRVGRGLRSGIGVHGFFDGGFLVEGGKRPGDDIAPLLVRAPFPDDWRVLLAVPAKSHGLAGRAEVRAFGQLPPTPASSTDELCRLVLLGLLPALAERDLPVFGEALYELNRKVGELFSSVQGGVYSHPLTAEIVAYLRQNGVAGVGQSSWGPTTFAIVRAEQANAWRDRIIHRFALSADEIVIATASP